MPLFLGEGQNYLPADELKPALRELDALISTRFPTRLRISGCWPFASYPPPEIENVVTRLWDEHMRRDRREVTREREAELGKPRDESSKQAKVEA